MRRVLGLMVVSAGVVLVLPATAQAAASLAWSPQTGPGAFDYGTVEIGSPSAQVFQLTNTGSSVSPVLQVRLSGSAAFRKSKDTCTSHRLGPGNACSVTITYAPTTNGQTDTTMLIGKRYHRSHVLASIALSGTGHGAPILTLSPGTFEGTVGGSEDYDYDFGTVSSATQTFTVTNSGNVSDYLTGVSGDDSEFQLSNDTCSGTTLAAGGGTCTFDVTATAPSGCSADVYGPDVLQVFDLYNPAPAIQLEVQAECPF